MGICFKYKAYTALFATFHGKGVVDGLRAFIKKFIWRIIPSQDCTIFSASKYADLARQRNPNIDILYITKSKVEESKPFLEKRFANVGSYSGCSQMHCFQHYGNNIINMSEILDCTTFAVIKAFIYPNVATKSESSLNQKEPSCES